MEPRPQKVFIEILFISFFILCSTSSYGQLSERSSSEELLMKEFKELTNASRTRPIETIKKVSIRLEEFRKGKNAKGRALSYLTLYWAHNNREDYRKASVYLDSLEMMIRKHDLTALKMELYHAKSRNYADSDKNNMNLEVIDSFYREALARKDSSNIAASFAFRANAFTSISEFDKAIENFENALSLLHQINDKKGLQSLYAMMGSYYGRRGEYKKGQAEIIASLAIAKERKDTLSIIRGLSNLSGLYMLDKNIVKAEETIDQRNKLIDQTEYPKEKKHSINMAIFYIEQENYDKALKELQYVGEYYEKNPNPKRQALVNHWKAITYRGLNQYDKSALHSQESYAISQSIDHLILSQISAYTLFQTYYWRDRNKEAIDWLLKSETIKDSIFSAEKTKEILNLETKYETAKKQQEIEILKAKSELDRVKKNQLWILLVALIGLSLLAIFTINMRRVKDKLLQEAELKNINLAKLQLEQQLNFKEKELASQLLNVAQKNEKLIDIGKSLDQLELSTESTNKKLIRSIQRQIKNDLKSSELWEQFILSFKSIHKNFTRIMVDQFELNASEIRLASLLKMNFNNKEIANLLNISGEGIKKARYRLRKKMKLDSSQSLDELILSID